MGAEVVQVINKEYLDTLTEEQILELVKRKEFDSIYFNAMQMALKLSLNSIYGAFGNKFFTCSNKEIAGTITAQGRDLIIYVIAKFKDYFYNKWHLDFEAHVRLGLTDVKKIDEKELVVIYGDTDSCFLSFKPLIKSCGFENLSDKEKLDKIIFIYNNHFGALNTKLMEEYAEMYNVENLHDFEIEKISKSGIWLGKKNYVLDIIWEEEGNVFYNSSMNILAKGVDIIKSSTPAMTRTKAKDIVKWLLTSEDRKNLREEVKKLKEIKAQFLLSDINDVSFNKSCNNYEDYVIDDTNSVVLASGCPNHIRASAYHNFIINNNPEMKMRYSLIKSGDKIKYYHTKDPDMDTFAFLRGKHPYEIAPKIDNDKQFEMAFLNSINRFNEAMGSPKINPDLSYVTSLLDIFKK